MAEQLQNCKLHIQPQAVPDNFQGITIVFRKKIYEQDQTMYKYIVAKLQIFKLQIQYMVNTLHERNLLHPTSYMSEIKRCFNISSFKCNLRQCLSLISLLSRLLPRRFSLRGLSQDRKRCVDPDAWT